MSAVSGRIDQSASARRVAQRILEEHLHGVRQAGQVIDAGSVEAVVGIGSIADAQRGTGIGRIDQRG